MAARGKQKRSTSSLISATECCRKARPEAALKMRPRALSVSCGQSGAHGAGFPKGTQNSAASGLEQVGESSCGFCRLLSLGSVYPGRGGK